ncbi:MAG: hypothetical protein NT167_20145 [Verrucomicrobia bacterium]|nr:hypothetical protein [Verrucomicrobiota bacterium]
MNLFCQIPQRVQPTFSSLWRRWERRVGAPDRGWQAHNERAKCYRTWKNHRCLVISCPSSPSQAVLRKVIVAAHTAAGMPPAAKKLLAQI